jgi:hypothetical protein
MTARPWMWTRGTPLHPTRTMAGAGRRGHMGVPVTHPPWAVGMTVGAGAGTGTGTGADGIGAGVPTTTDSGTTGAGVLWRAGTDLPCVWWTNESETRGTGGTGTETETGSFSASHCGAPQQQQVCVCVWCVVYCVVPHVCVFFFV